MALSRCTLPFPVNLSSAFPFPISILLLEVYSNKILHPPPLPLKVMTIEMEDAVREQSSSTLVKVHVDVVVSPTKKAPSSSRAEKDEEDLNMVMTQLSLDGDGKKATNSADTTQCISTVCVFAPVMVIGFGWLGSPKYTGVRGRPGVEVRPGDGGGRGGNEGAGGRRWWWAVGPGSSGASWPRLG